MILRIQNSSTTSIRMYNKLQADVVTLIQVQMSGTGAMMFLVALALLAVRGAVAL